ncbi:ANTH domain-containing protein [Tautonia plasticadhaerens]|nr:ANTH domain-containing protein [Tautonia plasticadhaerens]
MQHAPTPLSLLAEGEEEARRYKWIMSEKAGRDLGDWAIRCWVREHWNGFLRERWLEHLQGRAFWIELDREDYGLLHRAFRNSSPLFDEIFRRIKRGDENLEILNWAIEGEISTDAVIDILEAIDINSRRIECQFALKLSQAS